LILIIFCLLFFLFCFIPFSKNMYIKKYKKIKMKQKENNKKKGKGKRKERG